MMRGIIFISFASIYIKSHFKALIDIFEMLWIAIPLRRYHSQNIWCRY